MKIVGAEEEDAVVFVANSVDNAKDALKAVFERAQETLIEIPSETRAANLNGTTCFMRPRPGAARMYPETDIPPTIVNEEGILKISSQLPELPEKRYQRLIKEYKLNQKLAKQIMDSQYFNLFEKIVEESKVSPMMVSVFLTETMKALSREGVQVNEVAPNQTIEMFSLIGKGKITKEAIPTIFSWLSTHQKKSAKEAIEKLGLMTLSKEELWEIIRKIFKENIEKIKDKKVNSFKLLLGIVMKKVRGRADPAFVIKLIKEQLRSIEN